MEGGERKGSHTQCFDHEGDEPYACQFRNNPIPMIQEGVPRELPKYFQADDEEDHPEKYEGDEKTQRGHTIGAGWRE